MLVEKLRDIRMIAATTVSVATAIGMGWDAFVPYIEKYNAHLMLMMLMGFSLTYYMALRSDKILHDQIKETNEVVKNLLTEGNKVRLRAVVKQTFKDYGKVDAIYLETTKKYILNLEKEMADIGVNSFSSEMIEQLKAKFKVNA